MARTKGTKKEETHERIVRTAAEQIREHGYDGVSVSAIMDEAGLTHGGFYAHFASRDALLAEAVDQGAAESLAKLELVVAQAEPGRGGAAIIDWYLSQRHLAGAGKGCALAALGSETARQTPDVRCAATRQVKAFASLLARTLPGEDALAVLSALVGAMTLARAVDDPALASSILASTAKLLRPIER